MWSLFAGNVRDWFALLLQQRFRPEKAALPVTLAAELSNNAAMETP
jgi:hypothetical protein